MNGEIGLGVGRTGQDAAGLFREMLDTLPLIVWVHDASGQQVMVNETFCEFFGVTRQQMKGGRWKALMHPEDAESYAAAFGESLRDQKAFHHEVRVQRADGQWRWLESWGQPRFSESGQFRGMVGTSADITDRKRVEQALRRANFLIEGITQGTQDLIAAEDLEFRYTYFNDAYRREFKKLWGQDIEIGTDMLAALSRWPDAQRRAKELWSRALAGESFRVEAEFGPSSDAMRVYDLRFNPIEDERGTIVGAAHIFRDVTERVRVAQALEASEGQLREADQRKDDFLAMLGHELRNPLAAIAGATQLLEQAGTDARVIERATGALQRQTARMTRLVDGLLDVSRVLRGKVHLMREPLDLRQVIEDVVEDQRQNIEKRGLRATTNLPAKPVWVSGDRVRLVQVFDNLFDNAVKFTTAPGTITITLSCTGQSALVRLRDTGVGIRHELLDSIFEPFQQETQDIARSAGGLGLGLALSRGIIQLHDGSIEAISGGAGKGAEFSVHLPLVAPPRSVAKNPRSRASSSARVLIVEDHADAAEMLGALLEGQGHIVTAVADVPSALQVLRGNRIDLVLCDLGLPGVSGHELARQVRADPAIRQVGLVAVTGYGQPDDRAASAEVGFDVHLTKPVDIDALLEVCHRFASTKGGESP